MKRKILIISALVIIAIILLSAYFFFTFPKEAEAPNTLSAESQNVKGEMSPAEIMEVIKTDKDYNDLASFISGFDPEIITYTKLGPAEYEKIKPEWQKQGLADRITAIDKINLTDSTYWIELKSRNDETKGLRTVIDTKTKKSLLLIAALSIKAGIGL